jgi:hypothetical protein
VGIRDRIRDTILTGTVGGQDEPAAARRATQIASMTADMAADSGHPAAAAAISTIGAAVVAAEGALTQYVCPPGDYAEFDTDTTTSGGRP